MVTIVTVFSVRYALGFMRFVAMVITCHLCEAYTEAEEAQASACNTMHLDEQ